MFGKNFSTKSFEKEFKNIQKEVEDEMARCVGELKVVTDKSVAEEIIAGTRTIVTTPATAELDAMLAGDKTVETLMLQDEESSWYLLATVDEFERKEDKYVFTLAPGWESSLAD